MSTKRQRDKKKTMQVRVDARLHQLLKIEAAKSGESIKSLNEGFIVEGFRSHQ